MDISTTEATELLCDMPSRDAVERAERLFMHLPQVPLDTSHVIHGRMCARTILIPAGTFLTGALTEIDNICIVDGDITVTTDDGPRRLTGFHVLPANAGAKRAGLAHADTWWTTIIHTDLKDVSAIENAMTAESEMLQSRRLLPCNAEQGGALWHLQSPLS